MLIFPFLDSKISFFGYQYFFFWIIKFPFLDINISFFGCQYFFFWIVKFLKMEIFDGLYKHFLEARIKKIPF